MPSFQAAYRECFSEDRAIRSKFSGTDSDRSFTEGMAVGASLSLMSRILNVHEADWQKIDESQTKDLDFEIAAANGQIVEVECKGTVTDGKHLTTISNKKKDIELKKSQQRKKGNMNLLFGIITTFPNDANLNPTCYLLDPPPYSAITDPQKHKLVARLSYYLQEMNIILGSRFLIALANRIEDVASVSDYDSLSGKTLLNANSVEYYVPNTALSLRSTDDSQEFFGETFPFSAST